MEKTKGKHVYKWQQHKKFDVTPVPFTNEGFNLVSLSKHLPSFPETIPDPGECYDFFMTDEIFDIGLQCTNQYPRQIRSQM